LHYSASRGKNILVKLFCALSPAATGVTAPSIPNPLFTAMRHLVGDMSP